MPNQPSLEELEQAVSVVHERRVMTSRGKVKVKVRLSRNKVLLQLVPQDDILAFPGTVSQRGQA